MGECTPPIGSQKAEFAPLDFFNAHPVFITLVHCLGGGGGGGGGGGDGGMGGGGGGWGWGVGGWGGVSKTLMRS